MSQKRALDAPAGAVIEALGKAEHCGSHSTCWWSDSAKKACCKPDDVVGLLPVTRRSNAAWRPERDAGKCMAPSPME